MFYAVHVPGPPLRAHVERLWYYAGLEVDHPRERVLPEGTVEWIINLQDAPRYLFDDERGVRGTAFRRGWISGPQSRYLVIDALRGASMIGVHFHPGGAAAFLGLPAHEVADRVVEMDAIWGLEAVELREVLLEAPSAAAKFAALEAFLMNRWRPSAPLRNPVRYVLNRLIEDPQASAIADLAREVGWSHKHLIEKFRCEVGLGPKRLCRILRFQQVLQCVERGGRIAWAEIAVSCGYFDQAHFIREFHAFSGLNPRRYLCERGEHLNYVPIR